MSASPTFDEALARIRQVISRAEAAFLRDYEPMEVQYMCDGSSGISYVCWGPHHGEWRIMYREGAATDPVPYVQASTGTLYYIAVALPGLEERIRTERDHMAKLLNTTAERTEEWLRNRIARKEST